MLIHFICTGNVYRSRIAETYLKSKNLKDVEVSSSGINAEKNLFGPISKTAKKFVEERGLQEFCKESWDQTTEKMLKKADLIVFMENLHHEWCRMHLNYSDSNYEVWDIPDIGGEEVVADILHKVDNLVDRHNLQ